MYKYTLIVSQYYHSYHQFVVEHDDNFLYNAKNMARELIKYKRDEDDLREDYLGDLAYNFSDNRIRRRYNINDAGDIYIINMEDLSGIMYLYKCFIDDERRFGRGYKKKKVLEEIDVHHNYPFVKSIVKKHFNIL